MRTLYTLVHKDTQERMFRVYKTLSGARIAQANRNRLLGFKNRVERVEQYDNSEICMYTLPGGELVEGTYSIVEILVEDDEFERLYSE
jgi:hypothetical protein